MNEEFPMRINKYLAKNGVASRREVDDLISKKKITINGKVAELGQKVEVDDTVEVIGKMSIRNDEEVPRTGRMPVPGGKAVCPLDHDAAPGFG